jgi:hypothetical protein
VNTEDMLIAQPSCGEEGFNIALQMIEQLIASIIKDK